MTYIPSREARRCRKLHEFTCAGFDKHLSPEGLDALAIVASVSAHPVVQATWNKGASYAPEVQGPPSVQRCTANREGLILNLNSIQMEVAGEPSIAKYHQHIVGSPKPVDAFHALTIEADEWVDGPVDKSNPTEVEAFKAATLDAVQELTEWLHATGLEDLLFYVCDSGGKSIHTVFATEHVEDTRAHWDVVARSLHVLAGVIFAHHDVAIDPTCLRNPKQQYRAPVGMVLGRNQRMIVPPTMAYSDRPMTAILEAMPFEFPGDVRTKESRAAAVEAFAPFQKECPRLAAHFASQVAAIKAGEGTTFLESIGRMHADISRLGEGAREFARGALRTPNDVQIQARTTPRRSLNAHTAQKVSVFNPLSQGAFVDAPYDPHLLLRAKAVKPGAHATPIALRTGTYTTAELSALLCKHYLQTGETVKVTVSAPSEDGLDDKNPSCFARFDIRRGRTVIADSRTGEYRPCPITVGEPAIRAMGYTPVGKWLDLKDSPTLGLARPALITARPGVGKTTALLKAAKETVLRGKNVLIVQPTRTLVESTHASLEAMGIPVARYNDFRCGGDRGSIRTGEMNGFRASVVVTTVHSAHKCMDVSNGFDLVVFDELGTASDYFSSIGVDGTWTCRAAATTAANALRELAGAEGARVLFFEGIPLPTTMEVASLLAGKRGVDWVEDGGRGFGEVCTNFGSVIEEPVFKSRDVFTLSTQEAHAAILAMVERGKRCLIQCGTKKQAFEVESLLQSRSASAKVLRIDGANANLPEQLEVMRSPAVAMKYDVVISTTCLAAGVNFTNTFDESFIFHSTHASVLAWAQASMRERAARRIFFVANNTGNQRVSRTPPIPMHTTLDKLHRCARMTAAQAAAGTYTLRDLFDAEGFTVHSNEQSLTHLCLELDIPTVREFKARATGILGHSKHAAMKRKGVDAEAKVRTGAMTRETLQAYQLVNTALYDERVTKASAVRATALLIEALESGRASCGKVSVDRIRQLAVAESSGGLVPAGTELERSAMAAMGVCKVFGYTTIWDIFATLAAGRTKLWNTERSFEEAAADQIVVGSITAERYAEALGETEVGGAGWHIRQHGASRRFDVVAAGLFYSAVGIRPKTRTVGGRLEISLTIPQAMLLYATFCVAVTAVSHPRGAPTFFIPKTQVPDVDFVGKGYSEWAAPIYPALLAELKDRIPTREILKIQPGYTVTPARCMIEAARVPTRGKHLVVNQTEEGETTLSFMDRAPRIIMNNTRIKKPKVGTLRQSKRTRFSKAGAPTPSDLRPLSNGEGGRINANILPVGSPKDPRTEKVVGPAGRTTGIHGNAIMVEASPMQEDAARKLALAQAKWEDIDLTAVTYTKLELSNPTALTYWDARVASYKVMNTSHSVGFVLKKRGLRTTQGHLATGVKGPVRVGQGVDVKTLAEALKAQGTGGRYVGAPPGS